MGGGGRMSPHEGGNLAGLAGQVQQPFQQNLTLGPSSPRNLLELLAGHQLGQPHQSGTDPQGNPIMSKPGFMGSTGGQAVGSLLGTAIMSLLGAGLGAVSSPGARGLGAARGAGLGGLMGVSGDISQRRAASEIPATMMKTALAGQKEYSKPLIDYMGMKGISNPSQIDKSDFMNFLGQYEKLSHPMMPNEVSMLGPDFYGMIRDLAKKSQTETNNKPGINPPNPQNDFIGNILGNQ